MVKADGSIGKMNCLNVVPTLDGNIEKKRGEYSSKFYGRIVEQCGERRLYTSHFATCPQAPEWRKR